MARDIWADWEIRAFFSPLEADMAVLEVSKWTLFKFKDRKNVTHKWGLYPSPSHQLLFQTPGQWFYVLCVAFPLLAPSHEAAELSEEGILSISCNIHPPSTGIHMGMFNLAS